MLAVGNADRLDMERLRRVVECKTTSDAFKMLGDYGYAYTDGTSVDGFIVGETNKLIEFVENNAPSVKLCDALTARFKYNNAKLAYKSRFAAVPSDGYYNVDTDVKGIADGDYSETDEYMASALTALDESAEARPQAIDLALTRAMYAYVLDSGVPLVKKYFRAEIDMKNILTAARMKKFSLTDDQFISGGTVDAEKLMLSIEEDDFASCFEQTPYAEYAERIQSDGFAELWRSERDADEYLYGISASDVASYTSNKPFLNYYTETLIELKTVKTALVCIKTDSRDLFYKRVPAIYK